MNRRTFLAGGSAAVASSLIAKNQRRKLRVGVIGHTGRGNYGPGLDTVWLQVPETEIVAVADAHAGGLANAKKKLQVTALLKLTRCGILVLFRPKNLLK